MSEEAWADMERLRAAIQDAHLNFLVGAGTSSQLFAPLGDVEVALTGIAEADVTGGVREIARASVQALFFDLVIWPNVDLAEMNPAHEVVDSYSSFGKALNRILLARRSTLLAKHVSLFTTNVDVVIEVAFERLGLALNDGFAGRFRPVFDPGSFGSILQRTSPRYEHRSEVPVFDLIKLHGSTGWRWSDTAGDSRSIQFDRDFTLVHEIKVALDQVRDDLVTLPEPTKLQAADVLEAAKRTDRPDALDDFVSAYDRQVIVNPEKTKFATTVLMETYYELIRRFANELERETSVLFVHGFSFRDEHLRALVLRAARTNPTLQVFVLCFSRDDRATYQDLIAETDVPNGNLEYLVPPDETARFTLDEVTARILQPLVEWPVTETTPADTGTNAS